MDDETDKPKRSNNKFCVNPNLAVVGTGSNVTILSSVARLDYSFIYNYLLSFILVWCMLIQIIIPKEVGIFEEILGKSMKVFIPQKSSFS